MNIIAPAFMAFDIEFFLVPSSLIVLFIIAIFYLFTLRKALKLVSPTNRAMKSSFVWFNLIPVFSLLWHIYTVMKVSKSIKNEFRSRNIKRGDGGFVIGLLASIPFCIAGFGLYTFPGAACMHPCEFGVLQLYEDVPSFCFLMGFVFIPIYWLVIHRYNKIMIEELKLSEIDDDPDKKISSRVFLTVDLAGLALLAYFIQVVIKQLVQVFKEMGIPLYPFPDFMINNYVVIFILAAGFLILKEVLIKKKTMTLVINVVAVFVLCLLLLLLYCGALIPRYTGLMPALGAGG